MSSKMQIKGVVHDILKENGTSKSGKNWSKETVVMKTNSQYNPYIPFVFFNKESGAVKGAEVEATGWLEGREYGGKYYLELRADSISSQQAATPPPSNAMPSMNEADAAEQAGAPVFEEEEETGLPF